MMPDKCNPRIEHTCVSVSGPTGLTVDLGCAGTDLDTAGSLTLTALYSQLENFLDAASDALPPGVYTFTIDGMIPNGATAVTDTFTWTLTDPCLAPTADLTA